MTRRFITYAVSAFVITSGLSSCNDKSSDDLSTDTGMTAETLYSSTAITSFKLKDNSKVLTNLSGVFFTIDLNNAVIFNADSLPYGTNVKKLLMNIGTAGDNKIELTFIQADSLKTATVEYTTSSMDSVNFTKPVTVKVTSVNQSYTREYSIKVNVHQVKSDSLTWGEFQYSALPGTSEGEKIKSSATVEKDGRLFCYTQSGTQYKRADAKANLAEGEQQSWTVNSVNFGFTPDLTSMRASDDSFYVLSTDKKLYASADGLSWTATGESWDYIYGSYDNHIIGVKQDAGKYMHVAYPAPEGFVSTQIPAGCPIKGTSQLLSFKNEWSEKPLAIFVGGRKADGQVSGETWGYDGSTWALLGNLPKGHAYEGVTLVPYFTFKTNSLTWTFTKQSTLFAICGRNSDGYLSSKIYISRDQGLNWHEADELMQLPSDMEKFSSAQGYVCTQYLNAPEEAAGQNAWKSVGTRELPAWWVINDDATESAASRAVSPITSWECPYIYIFGGENLSYEARNQVWRGVINRLTFKPLQ